MRRLILTSVPALLVLLFSGDARAQPVASPLLWYARAGGSVARVSGGPYDPRALRGPHLTVGREFGGQRPVRALLELQGDWLTKPADDPTCAVQPGGQSCLAPVPDLRLLTVRSGAVMRRGRWHVAASAGPSLVSVEDAGRHGGVSGRVELAALASPNFGVATGIETTRIRSLQSRTVWIPRGGVAIRVNR